MPAETTIRASAAELTVIPVRAESTGVDEASRCRFGAPWWAQGIMLAVLVGVAMLLLRVVGDSGVWITHRLEVLFAIGGVAFWRWGWFVIQNARAIFYRYYAFPRLRRAAARAVAERGPVPEVIVLATTYKEQPWITAPVFASIFRELAALGGLVRRPRVIVVTGCDADDDHVRDSFTKTCGPETKAPSATWPPELVLLRGANGKRPALGMGMEEIARGQPLEDGVVIILDGDTMLGAGLLDRVLPMFRLDPPVDAVTTNENNLVQGPSWFAEWTSLRFGLRHRSMCSVALSNKLLCLTGRFSAFRATVVADPTFRHQVANDVIENWLWGSFAMLSGDDKSSWYWLAAHGKRMLYVPDAMVTTYEVIPGLGVHRALANIRRWTGNTVRHGWRAIQLGPRKLGWFAWWCLIDQRLTMVTALFGPAVALLAMCAGRWDVVAGYLLWILCSRVSHASISWRQGRRFSAFYVPLQVLSDWATALMKLWVVFHPAKQNWLNRGKRTLNTTKGSSYFGVRTGFAHYLFGFSCAAILITIGWLIEILPVSRDARLFLNPGPAAVSDAQVAAPVVKEASVALAAVAGSESSLDAFESGSETLILRASTASAAASRDAESHHGEHIEPGLHEQSKQ